MFKEKAIFFFVISALLIPLILTSKELFLRGLFMAIFILSQVSMLYLFYKEKKAMTEQWYVFGTALISLVYLLILLLSGQKVFTEFLGLLLFLIYFLGLLILLFLREYRLKPKKKKKPEQKTLTDEEFKEFREKDELQRLIDEFEQETRPPVEVVDVKEPEISQNSKSSGKLETSSQTKEYYEKETKKTDKEIAQKELEDQLDRLEDLWKEEFGKDMPASMIYDSKEEKPELEPSQKPIKKDEPEIRELKEAPKIDLDKVRQDIERIDEGVKTISDKIRVISEKAIREGKERLRQQKEAKKKPKPKKTELPVFASKTGNKYHYDRNCAGLRRVSKKKLVTYANSKEARKKKLKKCDLCRK